MRILHEPLVSLDGTPAELECYLLDNFPEIEADRRRPCVVVVPGGGYLECSPREMEPIAVRMLGYGFQACVLHYSTAPSCFPTALHELASAVAMVRAHADDWHIDPHAVLVGGFSAGGHLAADLGVEWNGALLAGFGFDAEVIRPDGLMLGYPVLSAGEHAHRPSFERLLGGRADDPAAREAVSIELRATAAFPPTFLFHTMTDATVPVANSLLLVEALRRAGVSVEAHLFPTGRHGVALGTPESMYADGTGVEECVQVWPDLFRDWVGRLVDSRSTHR
ncbi:alpha/beta hydrolase [Bifidobacterium cuniculi]|uniref:Putative lipase/esterase n=1 Tax=Bifidobacterium cuniculi TaxID=1688 RepID=A0A087B3E2_9BIFI|nr:alpha/beta hydrolase [Bifidobacterium cuniculi]KFI65542.1 putative lipase/esterase [Bifidobacterium cuniculi]